MPDIDWIALKTEYLSTTISYRKLAEKYGISFNTLKEHAVPDHWADERKKFNTKVATRVQQKIVTTRANECVEQLISVSRAASAASAMIEKIMMDADQFRRHLITVKEGEGFGMGEYKETQEVEERLYDKVDMQAFKQFTGAMKDLVQVIRNVNGLPTIQEQSAMDIALRRIELDEQKANEDDGPKEVRVEFEGGEDTSGEKFGSEVAD